MKQLIVLQRMHCNGVPGRTWLIAAWHWKWSLTWRWMFCWSPVVFGRLGWYFFRTYKYLPGLNFHCGLNLPLIGSFSMQTQPNMRLEV